MKKIMLVMAVMAIFGCLLPAGCGGKKYTTGTDGDFEIEIYPDHINITGLTEQGKEKEVIVIPKTIKGKEVNGIVKTNPSLGGFDAGERARFISDNLKKVIFTKKIGISSASFGMIGCPNLEKFIYLEKINIGSTKSMSYYTKAVYELYKNSNRGIHAANVSFLYNYADSENDGYYWIDDLDYGSLIDLIPEEPIRNGYTFGGWYKEEECINKWDFDTDRTPEEQLDEEENVVYQETILYAKWTAN